LLSWQSEKGIKLEVVNLFKIRMSRLFIRLTCQ
jgi:hypothetical protein